MRKKKRARCAVPKAIAVFFVCVCSAAILWQQQMATGVRPELATQANRFDYKDKIIIEQQREINDLKRTIKSLGMGAARSLKQKNNNLPQFQKLIVIPLAREKINSLRRRQLVNFDCDFIVLSQY